MKVESGGERKGRVKVGVKVESGGGEWRWRVKVESEGGE